MGACALKNDIVHFGFWNTAIICNGTSLLITFRPGRFTQGNAAQIGDEDLGQTNL